jgi:Domain of Unknown Function with PDB structure (DUF3857)
VNKRRVAVVCTFALMVVATGLWKAGTVSGDDWQPISPEELKMTSLPEAPGAPAVYLYRQVDRDDNTSREYNYVRIKILSEEGRKYADIDIPFVKGNESIQNLKARTIRPDGSVANFDGKIYEKEIVKTRGLKYLAKTFTLPDVQVGSIIEYHFFDQMDENQLYSSHWILSEQLFTRHAKFSLKPYSGASLRIIWQGLPKGTTPTNGNPVRLEISDIGPFRIEDFMPPENELKARVDFLYSRSAEKDSIKFWKAEGKLLNEGVENFVGKRKAMEQAVAGIAAASDSPDVKLQKIYMRVLQVHNTTLQVDKTEQEQKRAKEKENNNVEDVWKHGYGNGRQINWLFLAMARAAGFEANCVYLSSRNEYFFQPQTMNPGQLNSDVVAVKLNGKDAYFDPAAGYAPFGFVTWDETGVAGLRLDKEGGSWITTPIPESSSSQIARNADLKLSEDGTLQGTLKVTFSGLEALWRRVEERNEDAGSRKKFLEDQIKEYIPIGSEVELSNKPEWNSAATTFVAEYDIKVPGWASGAGRRVLVPTALFSNTEKHLFEHADRTHPIYFYFPFQKSDDVTIELPLGWQVSSVPKPLTQDSHVVIYKLKVDENKGVLHIQRQLDMQLLMLDVKYYAALRNFFQTVRTADEQQIVLQPGSAAAKN